MKMIRKMAAIVLAMLCAGSANASYQYVGSWYVGDGPVWTSTPTVYSAQEAAALLFGGSYSDYVISTVSANVSDINFMAYVDGYGDQQYLTTAVAQDFKVDLGVAGYDYNDTPDYSAYVLDHSCFNRYTNISATCAQGEAGLNYAFIYVSDVPEPASVALLGMGLLGLLAARRRRA